MKMNNITSRATNLINLTCTSCGASLEFNLDLLQAYCPFCGKKLMIDIDQLNSILIEKEKTKRQKMEYEHEAHMAEVENADKWKTAKWLGIFMAICSGLLFLLGILEEIGLISKN